MNENELLLPDGSVVEYAIRFSTRSRSVRLTLSARNGLVVVAPSGTRRQCITDMVALRADWVARHIGRHRAQHAQAVAELATRPQAITLPALNEHWHIHYQPAYCQRVQLRTSTSGLLVITAEPERVSDIHAALRRWLAQRARHQLPPWLDRLAASASLQHGGVSIRNQRSRWGSCSASGRISLNCKLLFLAPELVQYVLWHELCHLREMNHSPRFWTLLRRLEPQTDTLRARMRQAWETLPAWSHAPCP